MKSYFFKILLLIVFILGFITHSIYSNKVNLNNLLKEKFKNKITILDKIKAKKCLDVVILDAPVVYYVGSDDHKGFEYDLLNDYAKSMNLELNLTVVHTVKQALEFTRRGYGDLTAASLSVDETRLKEFKFGPYYHSINEELICHNSIYKRKLFPKELSDLKELNITIGKDTSAERTLENIKTKVEGFEFKTVQNASTQELLKKVWEKEIDCTVADTHIFSISQR